MDRHIIILLISLSNLIPHQIGRTICQGETKYGVDNPIPPFTGLHNTEWTVFDNTILDRCVNNGTSFWAADIHTCMEFCYEQGRKTCSAADYNNLTKECFMTNGTKLQVGTKLNGYLIIRGIIF